MVFSCRQFYKMSSVLLLLINVGVQASSANFYHNFWYPNYHAGRLNYCSLNQRSCGRLVANNFCKLMGYQKSNKFIIDYNVGLTNFISSASKCVGSDCNGFSLISCSDIMKHEPLASYYYRLKRFVFPRYEQQRIAWCYTGNHGCGKASAYSFCRKMGYMRAQDYAIQKHIGLSKAIGNHKLCFGTNCNGFAQITCFR